MKYIYDILLNFNERYIYDYYEWNNEDCIEYFRRIPIFQINENDLKNIRIGNVINDLSLLEKIHNMTEIYTNKIIRKIEYACLLTNEKGAVGVLLNKNGKILMISKMLLDEEEEAVEIGLSLKEISINILLCNNESEDRSYLTRAEKKKKFFLLKEIDELYKNKNIVKLKYLYFECFNEMEESIDIIYQRIKMFLNNEWMEIHDNLYNLVRLSYSKR